MKKRSICLAILGACATKAPTAGNYSGLYEISVTESTKCHFLVKKEKSFYPNVLCHDVEQAWAVPLKDMPGQVWASPPLLTQSGTLIAVTDTDAFDGVKINVLMSTDSGRNWDIQPLFLKKVPADKLQKISINKAGKLVATFQNLSDKSYEVFQEASLKAKFTAVKSSAHAYDGVCFQQHREPSTTKIPEGCLSGYLKRLLNQ